MLEDDYAEMVKSGNYKMDVNDLSAMDLDVYTMTKEEYDKLHAEWVSLGRPEIDLPLFPREETE